MRTPSHTAERPADGPSGPATPSNAVAGAASLFAGPGEVRAGGRALDWAATPLGPVEGWPAALCTAVRICLATPFPTAVLWGPELVFVYNDAYRDVLGAKHPGALGRPAREVWDEVWAEFELQVAQVLAGGPAVWHEDQPLAVARGDGAGGGPARCPGAATFTYSLSPLPDDAGAVGGVLVTVVEASARVRAEAALRASEERFRHIVEGARDYAIFTTDPEGRITSWSPGAEAIYGWPAADAIGRSADVTFVDVDRAAGVPAAERAAARATGCAPDVRWHQCRDGGRVFIEGTTRPLTDEAGALRGFLKVGQDVTRRREVDAALRASEARQAFLLALADALRPLADPAAVQRAALRVVGEHLGVDRVFYAEVTSDGGQLVIAEHYVRGGVSALTGRLPTARFGLPSETLRAGTTMVIPDVNAEPGFDDAARAAFAAVGVRAIIAVPLVKHGRWVSNLGVHQGTPRAWTADEVQLLEDAAERTWTAVERARAEAARHASEARYRTLVDNVPDSAIFLLDPAGVVTEWPEGAQRVKGYAPEEVIGRHVSLFYTPEDVEAGVPAAHLAEAAATGRGEWEGWRVRRDGTRFWADEIATAVCDGDGRLVGFSKISRDLTERRLAEEAAELAQLQAARDALRRALVGAEEAERQRLARELHDQLGQELTAFRLGLDDAARLAAGHVPPDAPLLGRIGQLGALAQRMTAGARYLALELRPPELDDVGLESALETYAAEWGARYGVAAEVAVTGLRGRAIPPDVASALYRIAQEALTNVAKHARAAQVSVLVDKPDGEVRLIVEDDGRGFDMEATDARVRRERRLGLAGMRERAALVGGTVAVESGPGVGTTVYVRLPVEHPLAPGGAAA